MMRALLPLLLISLAQGQGRVVILGVDGMDHAVTRAYLEAGALPELAALADGGSFGPLLPTNPAQSPTSWSTLTTGRNPGHHGVFGFLRRTHDAGRIRAEIALAAPEPKPLMTPERFGAGLLGCGLAALIPAILFRRRRRLSLAMGLATFAILASGLFWLRAQIPESLPVPRNLRSGRAFWSTLDAEGIPTISLAAPCAFPAPRLERGHLLSGLGVPDLMGTPGTVSVFRPGALPGGASVKATQMGGRVIRIRPEGEDGTFTGAYVEGPKDPLGEGRLRVPLTLIARQNGARLTWQDQELELKPGAWSDLVPVVFRSGAFIELYGRVRFRLEQAGDRPVLVQKPVQIDPARQNSNLAVTSPLGFGAVLAQGGPFATLGWATATNPYQDELIGDAAILDDVRQLVARRADMVMKTLGRDDWRVHFSVLSTPDRVQHVFWRDRDPEHPGHDPAAAARRGDVILESYRAVDQLVGRIRREVLRPEDHLLVVSDHGFASFRHAVNLNRWLVEEGYLVGRADGGRTLADHLGREIFAKVDWSKTRAYSMGLGRIWLNRTGREPEGIVTAEEAEALEAEIRTKLLALVHETPAGPRRPVRSVARAAELYEGERVDESADLVVGFAPGYRVSWASCLGGIDEPVIFDNLTRWSGDHCSVDPAAVPGVIFSRSPLRTDRATVADVYPTLRALLGLGALPELDGRSLLP